VKFRCESEKLADALSAAQRVVGARASSLPGLSGLRLRVEGDQLEIFGTDYSVAITRVIDIGAAASGVVVVPAKLLTDIVRTLEGQVTVETQGEKLSVTATKRHFTVATMPNDDFPQIPAIDGGKFSIDAKQFVEAIHQVARAASTDDARPILTGVLFSAEEGGLRMVATDSYRLALRDLPNQKILEDGQKVLIPARALREVERMVAGASTVEITFGDKRVGFSVDGAELTTSLIDGEFPNYRQLIPKDYPNALTVDKARLIEEIRSAQAIVKDALTPIRVTLKPDTITLAVSQEGAQATLDVEGNYTGQEMTVAFNPAYFREGVEAVPGERVVIETVDPMKTATVRGVEDREFLYLLMPVRVA
jgi:DNA polymerase-3 subunit beta